MFLPPESGGVLQSIETAASMSLAKDVREMDGSVVFIVVVGRPRGLMAKLAARLTRERNERKCILEGLWNEWRSVMRFCLFFDICL
jgi:hypothetical protein